METILETNWEAMKRTYRLTKPLEVIVKLLCVALSGVEEDF